MTLSSAVSFRKSTLDNGLRVITGTMPHARSVSAGIFVGVGSRHESDAQAGLSHFVEHLLFKGTERRPGPSQVTSVVEGVGGTMNGATEQEMSAYWCKVARRDFEESLDLLFDMIRNSRFDPADIDKERQVVFEELGMVKDDPNDRVEALLDGLMWPDHPLGREVAGSRESVAGITRDMLMEHLERYYCPSNVVLSVAGDVEHGDVLGRAAALSRDWTSHPTPPWAPVTFRQSAARATVEYRKTEQAHLSIAVPGVSLSSPDRYAVELASVILGEGMSSRLFLEVRENQGLAYEIHSTTSHFQDCGAIAVDAGVDPARVEKAVCAILAELSRLRETVSEEELAKAKRLYIGRMMLQMEDTRVVSGWMGAQELLRGETLDADDVATLVEQVTVGDVRRVSGDLLVGYRLNMAVVGPCRSRKRLEGLLSL